MTVFEHAGKQAWPCSPLAVKPVQQLRAHWLAGQVSTVAGSKM